MASTLQKVKLKGININVASYLKTIVLIIFIGVSLFLAFHLSINNPDEMMRYMLPQYLYKHHSLPVGTQREVIANGANWSYAYYPQWLGPFVSTIFMTIIGLFNDSGQVMLFAARLTSVLAGTLSLFLIRRIVAYITNNEIISVLVMAMVAFLPQFTYLSSYVNNDIISVLGVAIIVYAMVRSLDDFWSVKNVVLLAIGVITTALSYMNAYGWILAAAMFYLTSAIYLVKQGKWSWKSAIKTSCILVGVICIVVLPFFIRNYIIYHDFTGMSAFHKAYMKYIVAGGKPLQIPYNGSFFNLITDKNFYTWMQMSTIGRFGYLTVNMAPRWYLPFTYLFFFGVILYIIHVLKAHGNVHLMKREAVSLYLSNILSGALLLGSVITIGLHLYYCLVIDFQPQGRYIVTLLIPVAIIMAAGYNELFKRLSEKVQNSAVLVGVVLLFMFNFVVVHRFISPLFV
jgi:hypothetical protein